MLALALLWCFACICLELVTYLFVFGVLTLEFALVCGFCSLVANSRWVACWIAGFAVWVGALLAFVCVGLLCLGWFDVPSWCCILDAGGCVWVDL